MLVARCASVNGSKAAKVVRFAHVLQGGFEGTDLATLAHLEYPQSATGILCKSFYSRSRSSKLGLVRL